MCNEPNVLLIGCRDFYCSEFHKERAVELGFQYLQTCRFRYRARVVCALASFQGFDW